jgi:glycosyltransferase 2 family protein
LDRIAAPLIARIPGRQSKHSFRPIRPKNVVVWVLALACLVWVFHDIHFRPLLAAVAIASWPYVALAILLDVLTYVLQGMRWSLLLAPVGRLSILKATQGVYTGLFINELVPLRPGELVRAFLAGRWLSTSFNSILPSIVLERLIDGVWVTVGISVAAMFAPLPHVLVGAGEALGIVILLASVGFLWIVFGHPSTRQSTECEPKSLLVRKVLGFISQFRDGVREIGFSNRLYSAIALSFGMLVSQILALWFLMHACRIALPLFAAGVVFLIVRIGTMIPNAPANIGSFQLFTFLALRSFGVEKTVAAGFSILYFSALTLPLWALGLLSLTGSGVSLSRIPMIHQLRSSGENQMRLKPWGSPK